MSAPQILYDDEEIRVVHRPGSSDFTLVTFGALTHRARGTAFWGDGPAGKLDLDAVGFMPKRENWYPAAAVARSAPAVRAVLRPVAIGYGFSMGGYGALKYGTLLGLTHALAVSPQVTIDPAELPREPRYHRFFRPGLHAAMRVTAADLAPVSVIAADWHDPPDRLHAELAAATGATRRLPLSFMGHDAIWLFASSAVLRRVLDLLRAEDFGGLRDLVRARRRDSLAWHRFIAREACGRGQEGMAERLWQRAVALGLPATAMPHERATGMEKRVRRLFVQGRAEEAAALATGPAMFAQYGKVAALVRMGRLLLAKGRGESALVLFRRAIALKDDPAAHASLVHALAKLGRPEEALRACRQAVQRHPGDPHLALKLGQAHLARGEFAAAEIAFRTAIEVAAADDVLAGHAGLGLSHALAKRRHWPEALASAREAVALLPGQQQAAAWLHRLQARQPAGPDLLGAA